MTKKIKVWIRTEDMGDGSSNVSLFPTEKLAKEGVDSDGFYIDEEDRQYQEVPMEISWCILGVNECEEIL